jgi:bifunctional enzyme CysN/CysC
LKQTTRRTSCEVETIRYGIDVNTLRRGSAASLGLNEIGRCRIVLHDPVMYDGYDRNRTTGCFILVDRITHETAAAGMFVQPGAEPPSDGHWDDHPECVQPQRATSRISDADRSARYRQSPATILITGLSGSGKTSVAMALEQRLFDAGCNCLVLDGQSLRLGISRDLGFSAEERSENLRRAAEIAKLINDAGQICIAAFVAPSEWVRQKARALIGHERFIHVHLSTLVEVCRRRDITGQYRAADRGEIASFPGVTFAYESPSDADMVVDTEKLSADQVADHIIELMKERSLVW